MALGGLAGAERDGSLGKRTISFRRRLEHTTVVCGRSSGTPLRIVFWQAWSTARVPRFSKPRLRCSGHRTWGGPSSRVARRPISEGGPPQGSDIYARTAKLRISTMQKSVSRVIAQGPKGDSSGEQETMILLDENLTKKGHDTHIVVKITKEITRNSWRNCRTNTGNLEDKTEGNRRPGAEGHRGPRAGENRWRTAEGNRGLIPA